jgi:glutathionyl-hydroquinone reductase
LSMMKWDPLTNFDLPSRIFKQSIVSVSEATSEIIRVYGEAYKEFESSGEDEIEIQPDDRMSEIKEEIDRLRSTLTSSNNHILH